MPDSASNPPAFQLSDHLRRHGFISVIVLIYLFFSIISPSYFGISNLVNIVNVISPILVVGAGMALVVMAGKLDISVGSIAYVASAIIAVGLRDLGLSLPTIVFLALSSGLIMGAANAFIVVFLRVNSLIATLATMISFRGIGLMITDGGLINLPPEVRRIASSSLDMPLPGSGGIAQLQIMTLIALATLIAVHVIHRRTNFGRQLTAIGNHDETARRLGIPVTRRLFTVFVISGLLGALGGTIFTMQVGVSTAKIGEGMEFIAIAVVVVGGISLFGGRGHILKAVLLGALAFQLIRSGLQHSDASPYSFRMVEGIVIFIAMYFDALKRD